MKVESLINFLSKMSPDAEVFVLTDINRSHAVKVSGLEEIKTSSYASPGVYIDGEC